jgi:hypothetical protein
LEQPAFQAGDQTVSVSSKTPQRVVSLEAARHNTRRRKRYAAAPDDARPVIHVVPGDIERMVNEAEAALIAAGRGLYQRDGRIVSVGDVPVLTAHGREVGAQSIAERGDHALLEDLAAAAQFVKFDARAKGDVAIDPPVNVVKTLRRRGRLRFPILAGIINAPTMRGDGSILDTPGYDETTGLLFDPLGVEFPAVPEHPTYGEARAALALLKDLISTFPFVEEVDRSVALSGILTVLVRRSLPTAPLHAYTAPIAGSGKSMLVDLASIIATGHEAGVIAQGKSEEEMEKRLGAVLMAGDSVIAIDNCEVPLGGELLCQMLTQTRVKARILGHSSAPELSTGASSFATGNNLVLVGDLTRRAMLCRLDPKHERPETRPFDRNPIAFAKTNRPALVAAALTVLRAFRVAGGPEQETPLGSFEDWSHTVRDALIWLGSADPVASMETVRRANPVTANIGAVMQQWSAVIGPESTTVADVIRWATERGKPIESDTVEFKHSDFREVLLTVAGNGGAINSGRLGKWLSGNANRIVNGRRFESAGERSGVALWRLASTST